MINKAEIEIQDVVSDDYENIRYEKPYSRAYHLWWSKMMIDHAPAQGLWLDLGCGTGWTVNALSELGYKRNIIGLDISSGMLKWAKKKGMMVFKGDAQCLPFDTASFDVVMAKGVLHHVPEVETAVSEIARVLKPGGVALLVDPNPGILRLISRVIPDRSRHFSEDHKSIPAEEYLLLISRHLNVKKFDYFGFFAYPFCFPDLLDIGGMIPFSIFLVKILIKSDSLIACIPGIRKLSWGYFVKAVKNENEKL